MQFIAAACHKLQNFIFELRRDFFIGVEQHQIIAGRMLQLVIALHSETFPLGIKIHLRTHSASKLHSVVHAAVVNHQNFIREARALQAAVNLMRFVFG